MIPQQHHAAVDTTRSAAALALAKASLPATTHQAELELLKECYVWSMANWFIGLPVATGAWFDAIEVPPAVRKFGPDDVHLTVAFLGAVEAELARRAFAEAAAFPLPRLTIELGKLEALGDRRHPSAFSALLTRGREEVERAIGQARAPLYALAKARPDPRPPLAHATLARPQRRIAPSELAHAIAWAHALELGAPRVELDRIALYTWSADRRGALFRIDRSCPLRD
jgi:2'-5' RNA ligase